MCRLPNRTIQSVYDGFDFDVNTVNPDNFAAFGCPEVDELPLSYFSPGVSNSDGMNSDESMRLGGLEMPVDSRATVGGKFDDVKQEPGSDRIFGVMNDLASMPASAGQWLRSLPAVLPNYLGFGVVFRPKRGTGLLEDFISLHMIKLGLLANAHSTSLRSYFLLLPCACRPGLRGYLPEFRFCQYSALPAERRL